MFKYSLVSLLLHILFVGLLSWFAVFQTGQSINGYDSSIMYALYQGDSESDSGKGEKYSSGEDDPESITQLSELRALSTPDDVSATNEIEDTKISAETSETVLSELNPIVESTELSREPEDIKLIEETLEHAFSSDKILPEQNDELIPDPEVKDAKAPALPEPLEADKQIEPVTVISKAQTTNIQAKTTPERRNTPVIKNVKQKNNNQVVTKYFDSVRSANANANANANVDTNGGDSANKKGAAAPADTKHYIDGNYNYINNRIRRYMVYPPQARRMNMQGVVTVRFTITVSGKAEQVVMIKSSGYDILDQAAIDAIKRASPFPPPPAAATIVIPIRFSLR